MPRSGELRVALVHYWLVNMRGGERVLESLARLFPNADIYTHVVERHRLSDELQRRRIMTTGIARLPFATRAYQYYLPLMPIALEQLDLREYDLVISSESGPAKGVITAPGAAHICYCHSPMRYAWELYPEYAATMGLLTRALAIPVMHYMRLWDFASAQRVDRFIANSHHVRRRIAKAYRRDADVVYPPVAVEAFRHLAGRQREDFFLVAGQLVPYKRVDVAIQAFAKLGRKLVVIGEGPEYARLKRMAPANVELLGWQPDAVLRDYLSRCRALVFPGEEDFGILPVEAMATGAPVIAYGRGGVLDTVVDGVTGILYDVPSASGLIAGVTRFEDIRTSLRSEEIVAHATTFSRDRFDRGVLRVIEEVLGESLAPSPPSP